MKSILLIIISLFLISSNVFASETKISPDDLAFMKRAEGKCLKNVHLVAPGVIKGDWVCAPPRAASSEKDI